MPRISEARREQRRAEIVDAALRCFVRNGYQRTSMADIIAESGLSAGAIYGYFPGKSELVRSAAARILAGRREEIAAAGATRALSPAEIARMLVDGIRREAPLAVLVQVWGEATVDEELRDLVREPLEVVHETVATNLERWALEHPDRIPAGAAARTWAHESAPVLMGLVPGFVLQRALRPGFDEETFLRAIGTLLPAD